MTIVLMNGCFHIGPVICSRSVIMAPGWLEWPEATAILGPLLQTVNSEIIAFIYYCDFEISVQNAR